MKKLFVLLLTGVMCFCLLGINSNRINAEDSNAEEIGYSLCFMNQGSDIDIYDDMTPLPQNKLSDAKLEELGIEKISNLEFKFTKNIKCTSNTPMFRNPTTSSLVIKVDDGVTFEVTNANIFMTLNLMA